MGYTHLLSTPDDGTLQEQKPYWLASLTRGEFLGQKDSIWGSMAVQKYSSY